MTSFFHVLSYLHFHDLPTAIDIVTSAVDIASKNNLKTKKKVKIRAIKYSQLPRTKYKQKCTHVLI